MRQISSLGWTTASLTIFLFICSGCDAPSVTELNVAEPASASAASDLNEGQTSPASVVVTKQSEQLQTEATQQQAGPGLLEKASKLLSDAQKNTGQSASNTGQWLQGALEGATDSTSNTMDGSLEWANETFKSLKGQGLTTASSTGQWLSEDWQNMESWEYKVLASNSLTAEDLETKLNELGKQGWECFSIDDQRMIFKKASESYLRRLPFKDILRLAPLLDKVKQ